MENSKVSIVVPVFKVEDVIENTLKSIINQTYKNLELILVNDGTPDNSIQIAKNYLVDKNIEWRVLNQENSGLPTARNNGIKAATGEWVICPDSDDVLAPQAIEKMLEAAHIENADCVFCGYKTVTKDDYFELPRKNPTIKKYYIAELRKLFLKRELILLCPGMLLKRTVYTLISYDKNCPYDEDINFMWRLFYLIDNIVYIDADYYNYYLRTNSMVHTLKPAAYLKASACYRTLEEELSKKYPADCVVPLIYPKYRLGGLHVLARSTDYKTFRNTVKEDDSLKGISKILTNRVGFKLWVYALTFTICLPLFYIISKIK